MKTKIVITFSLILLAMSAKSETATSRMNATKTNYIKPYVGVGSFHINGLADDFTAKSGIVAGATYEFNTPVTNLAVEAGLDYMQAGAQREYVWVDSGEQAIKQELNLDYVAIPVRARYQIYSQEVQSLKYQAIGGLTVASLLSAKSKTNVFGQSDEKDVISGFNTTDLQASIGVGVEYEIQDCKGNFDMEYTRGMLDVTKNSGGRNEGIILKAGFAMAL